MFSLHCDLYSLILSTKHCRSFALSAMMAVSSAHLTLFTFFSSYFHSLSFCNWKFKVATLLNSVGESWSTIYTLFVQEFHRYRKLHLFLFILLTLGHLIWKCFAISIVPSSLNSWHISVTRCMSYLWSTELSSSLSAFFWYVYWSALYYFCIN